MWKREEGRIRGQTQCVPLVLSSRPLHLILLSDCQGPLFLPFFLPCPCWPPWLGPAAASPGNSHVPLGVKPSGQTDPKPLSPESLPIPMSPTRLSQAATAKPTYGKSHQLCSLRPQASQAEGAYAYPQSIALSDPLSPWKQNAGVRAGEGEVRHGSPHQAFS